MPTHSALADVYMAVAGAGRVPFLAHLFYDSADPYTVQVQFFDRGTALARWHFDRQMLAEGLHRRVGEGDVAFRPHGTADGDEVLMELRDHTAPGLRTAVVGADTATVAEFLEHTYALVPAGTETLDLDGPLQDLLAR
ncbi:SsgA family sporulation/cell division regulator [Streptomyces globosus]|uniref:SsgA family sporulation/cell division regulator n=1 Tax=Streptomyces globosus TaxID=68209 RepID=A0A344U196_9ACTN|nr:MULTISPECIES: SsgA family sporulation/cell division regulator [Streptomyces]AXE24667.1 SsgA family sporulation/cell division regulator [Streptomyces globosus]